MACDVKILAFLLEMLPRRIDLGIFPIFFAVDQNEDFGADSRQFLQRNAGLVGVVDQRAPAQGHDEDSMVLPQLTEKLLNGQHVGDALDQEHGVESQRLIASIGVRP